MTDVAEVQYSSNGQTKRCGDGEFHKVESTNISFQDKKDVFWDLDLQVSHQMALYNIVDMDAKQQVGDQHRFSRLHGSKETTTV